MPALTIKSIPEELYQELKKAAKTHHRSLNSEVIASLELILKPVKMTPRQHLENARAIRSRIHSNHISMEDIDSAKKNGRP